MRFAIGGLASPRHGLEEHVRRTAALGTVDLHEVARIHHRPNFLGCLTTGGFSVRLIGLDLSARR